MIESECRSKSDSLETVAEKTDARYRIMLSLSEAFALKLKNVLREKNMTQYRLAFLAGVHPSTITNVVHAKTKACNLNTMAVIVCALGMSVSEFFDDPLFDYENFETE